MTPTNIKQLIGDYETFFSDILTQLSSLHINIQGMPISHMCYRVTTILEYETLRDQLKPLCRLYDESEFNGRPVSLLILKTPLMVSKNTIIPMIELPAPRQVHMYPTGLEHVGIIVGKQLPEFRKKYKNHLTGEKDRKYYTIPFITFPNNATVKFYEYSLRKIVENEGRKFRGC